MRAPRASATRSTPPRPRVARHRCATPGLEMVALVAADLDGMADLDDIEPVSVERVRREALEDRGCVGGAMRHPPGRAAGNESNQRGRYGAIEPLSRAALQPLQLQPRRHRFLRDGVVAGVQ